jgi:[ribosomal protein S5]-alanine N-acetyltransferase
MPTPTIETERLVLRPFDRADAANVFAYASDPSVSRFTSWETHRTPDDSLAFIEMVLGRPESEMTWAIRLRTSPKVIGAIEFGPTDQAEARIDYVLAEPFWNQGLMTEAAKAVLAWGLEHCPAVNAVASCAVTQNVGSQRVMEKCGLTFDRVQTHRWPKCTEPVEQRHYRLLRSDSAAG